MLINVDFPAPLGPRKSKKLTALNTEAYALECINTREVLFYIYDLDCSRHA